MSAILLSVSVVCIAAVNCLEYVTVNSSLGPITGYKENVTNSELHVFLGIPYAKSPVGNRRFKAPLPVDPWSTPYNAQYLPKSCPQIPYPTSSYFRTNLATNISEDCLYLNIWVPVSASCTVPKAVMLWIYGGAFKRGSTSETIYDGRILATQGDVIVVTINYRLGILGFLYFGTSDVPGNMGLMDQYMAIKWVYDNIGKFGGDPHRITIFGESAGGNSVAYHMITAQPKYFTRAIMQSTGSNLFFGYIAPRSAKQLSLQYAAALGCSAVDLVNTTSCLKSLNVTFILSTILSPNVVPTTDGVFLTTSPYQLSHLMEVQNIDILAGFNGDDGFPFLYQTADLTPFFKNNLPISSINQFTTIASAITNLNSTIVNTCLPEAYGFTAYNDSRITLVALATDALFACQCQAFSEALDRNGNTVYRYRFNYGGSYRNLPSWVEAAHTDEIPYVFGLPLNKSFSNIFNNFEVTLTELVIGYWTNFSKFGNPNGVGPGSSGSNYWARFTEGNQLQVIFTSDGVGFEPFSSQSECLFWDTVYPLLLSNPGQYESLCAPELASSSTSSVSSSPSSISLETLSSTMPIPISSSMIQKANFVIYCITAVLSTLRM